jgi:hypothetical protein
VPGHVGAVLSLQRAAGNAAVTRALAAGGHGLTVQRARPHPGSLTNNVREQPGSRLFGPSEEDQRKLEKAFPKEGDTYQQFPNPVKSGLRAHLGLPQPAEWVKLINSHRDEKGMEFLANCVEAVRSFLASWSGNPTAAAGVDQSVKRDDGGPMREDDGPGRTSAWLNTRWRDDLTEDDADPNKAWGVVADRLRRAGHGASAIVVFEHSRASHAVAGVNYQGAVIWVDAQLAKVHLEKAPWKAVGIVRSITLDSSLLPFEAPEPINTSTLLTLD